MKAALHGRGAILAALLAAGCSPDLNLVPPDWDLNRMKEQPRYRPFGASGIFEDGRAMRPPPEGTVARDEAPGPPAMEGGLFVERVPVPVTRELLERGRSRFEIFCAACHGLAGDGESVVARKMPLVKPPSLLSDRIRAYPPGRIFEVIRLGFGMMPAYAFELDARDRWAVVAYLRALQLSQRQRLADLPEPLRRRAEEALP